MQPSWAPLPLQGSGLMPAALSRTLPLELPASLLPRTAFSKQSGGSVCCQQGDATPGQDQVDDLCPRSHVRVCRQQLTNPLIFCWSTSEVSSTGKVNRSTCRQINMSTGASMSAGWLQRSAASTARAKDHHQRPLSRYRQDLRQDMAINGDTPESSTAMVRLPCQVRCVWCAMLSDAAECRAMPICWWHGLQYPEDRPKDDGQSGVDTYSSRLLRFCSWMDTCLDPQIPAPSQQ
jgi:hypothetical protein